MSTAINTWAVDYVLLKDEKDQILGETYGYRDHRTDVRTRKLRRSCRRPNCMQKQVSRSRFSILFIQLMAVKQQTPELLQQAKTLLMLRITSDSV